MDDTERHLREVLREDALRAPVRPDLAAGVMARTRRERRRWLASAAVVAAVVGLVPVANSLWPEPEPGPASRTGALPDSGLADCEPPGSASDIAQRSFAFAGTVTAIDSTLTDYTTVTFTVDEWFKGGPGRSAEVTMPAPLTIEGPSYEVGTRLLVSGDGRKNALRAWGCGYTRYADSATAQSWRAAME